jgi:hypothetical protein
MGLADIWLRQYWATILCTFIPSIRLARFMRREAFIDRCPDPPAAIAIRSSSHLARSLQVRMAVYARPRSLHEPHHCWVLPTKQTGGRAKAREALLDFSGGNYAVVHKGHEAASVAELAVAFWALAKGLQLVGDDEVFGFQRVKHHSLRED